MSPIASARPTIIDVANRAGVSKSLVSLVMRGERTVSDEKRALVLAAASELGYRPNAVARSLVRRRTNLFGIVLSDLHNPFFAEVIDGVQEAAGAEGYRTIISTVDLRAAAEQRALDTLLELRVDGLILASPMFGVQSIAAASGELPMVLVARRSDLLHVDSVTNDDPKGACLVVEHLVDLGHRRIAHIDGGRGAGAAERRQGYEHTMVERGLGELVHVVSGSYTEEGGRHGVEALLADDTPPPTAIFVSNDLAALGALAALAERGIRVPQDVSIVGYDNTALAALRHINLTTVDQPRPDMGREAVALLLDRMTSHRETARHVTVTPTLVVRGTTAPPNGT
jgi:DNA-binding LacI/PurR family transcriptional regulator